MSVTTLSIVHPASQQNISQFYEDHHHSILASCSISKFTLRRPLEVAQKYAEVVSQDQRSSLKSGTVQQEADETEADISHIVSYFSYERYNLLGKFIKLREFLDLEKQFVRLRTLDISKCFFNIYTHSITWAVKDKRFAKENRNTYSFKSEFDTLMQRANYNETNEIVIGPEISRIFAEIIFQSIDRLVQNALSEANIIAGKHYEVRRYVDDYFIFSNTDELIDRIEATLRDELERFKLFINDRKSETFHRPFVSNLSQARNELRDIVSSLWSIFDDGDAVIVDAIRKRQRWLNKTITQVRLIVAKHGVEFGNISGWLLAALRNFIKKDWVGVERRRECSGRRDHRGAYQCTS